MHFVYPRDLIAPKLVEEVFRDEADALRDEGHTVSLVDTDALRNGTVTIGPLPATYHEGQTAVYRGWMLTPNEYDHLLASFRPRYSFEQLTHWAQYLNAHYLPRWYPLLADLTPETIVFALEKDHFEIGDMMTALEQLDWPAVFVKDFVKSHKTGRGSIIHAPNELPALLDEMRAYRGELEGGICFRRVEDFVPETETRYFVLRGTACGADADAPVPPIVSECARRIDSPFFSVDVALRADGVLRVVEIGDGQVSDLTGWTPEQFSRQWRGL